MEKRVAWIDQAKGIGIILVVYGHVILGLHDSNIHWNTLNYQIQYSIIYHFHMALFMFLSGLFVERWIHKSFKQGLKGKLQTLILPYFLWGTIQGIVMQLFSGMTNRGQGLHQVLLLPIKPYAQFWFLYDLFFMFILYRLLRMKCSKQITVVIATIIFFISPFIPYWEVERISHYFIFFALGGLLQSYSIKSNIPLSTGIFIVINAIYFVVQQQHALGVEMQRFFDLCLGVSGIYFIYSLTQSLNISSLIKIGKLSMPIYLMHLLATAGIRIILFKLGIANLMIQLILGTVGGILLPIIGYYVINFMKLSFLFGQKIQKVKL